MKLLKRLVWRAWGLWYLLPEGRRLVGVNADGCAGEAEVKDTVFWLEAVQAPYHTVKKPVMMPQKEHMMGDGMCLKLVLHRSNLQN